ncbi:uncharacterized protein F4812DRAFT_464047 [Daldinia caldariorum]|uniref:uncharacterized protein n=1 Tax=Daldinia caldariorum TaxID=326644 RepID=UPI002008EAD7|nr:uncharacterized protein F4812DRAFT_464047 [Daldinia caldariorum]KAI1463194.1 hypothetical protein F4812DRAFT_464047 [Daldinia caldariorum]
MDMTSIESLAPTVKKANSSPKVSFFSLALELRQMIYEEVYDVWWEYGIWAEDGDSGIYHSHSGFPNVRLNEVCRQMYQDVTPYIYKKVSISDYFDDWDRFFTSIGAHNISNIRNLTLHYSCSMRYKKGTWEPQYLCYGLDENKLEYDRWETIFWCLSQANLKAKSVKITFDTCDPAMYY